MINKLKFTSIAIYYFFIALLSVSQGMDDSLTEANDKLSKYKSNIKFLGKVDALKIKVEADINNEDFNSIVNLKNINTLDLNGSVGLNGERIKSIALLTSLTKLDLTNCKKNNAHFLKGSDLDHLSSLTNLKNLVHTGINIKPAEANTIKNGRDVTFESS